MKLINDWLNGKRNYTYGSILYNRYGNDDELKNLFEKGKTEYTEKKLLEELQAIAKPQQPKKISERTLDHANFPTSTNKVVSSLRDQWMPLYTEMNYKRHSLDKFLSQKTDAATRRRGNLAMEILDLEKRCMYIWAQRDHYLEFGRLPTQEKTDPVIDPAKLVERYKNVQGYIRRYKMYLRQDPTDPKNIALLKQYEDEYEELKKKRSS